MIITHDIGIRKWVDFIKTIAMYIGVCVGGTMAIYYLLPAFGSKADYVSMTASIKLISLAYLILIDLPSSGSSNNVPQYIRISTRVIAIWTSIVVFFLLIKLFSIVDGVNVSADTPFGRLLGLVGGYGDILSISPLVMYAFTNFYSSISEYRKGNVVAARASAYYFVVADMPCIIPIIGVFAIASTFPMSSPEIATQAHVFTSGAMAMFIFTSNMLTLCVEKIIIGD